MTFVTVVDYVNAVPVITDRLWQSYRSRLRSETGDSTLSPLCNQPHIPKLLLKLQNQVIQYLLTNLNDDLINARFSRWKYSRQLNITIIYLRRKSTSATDFEKLHKIAISAFVFISASIHCITLGTYFALRSLFKPASNLLVKLSVKTLTDKYQGRDLVDGYTFAPLPTNGRKQYARVGTRGSKSE